MGDSSGIYEKDGGEAVHICGDYKPTLNKCMSPRQFPLPTVDEFFNAIQGMSKVFKNLYEKGLQQPPN